MAWVSLSGPSSKTNKRLSMWKAYGFRVWTRVRFPAAPPIRIKPLIYSGFLFLTTYKFSYSGPLFGPLIFLNLVHFSRWTKYLHK